MSISVKKQNKIVIVTRAEDKGTWGQINFTTNRLEKKGSDKKITSYWSFWKMFGTAYQGFDKLVERLENAPKFENSDKKKGVMIVIKDWDMSMESYQKDGETVYPKSPQFIIWGWDFYKKEGEGGTEGMDTAPEVQDAFGETDKDENPFGDE